MLWQDYVISAAQIGFIIALVPTLKGKDKPAVFTSFMTAGLLAIITFCMFTLHLYFSAATTFAIMSTWTIIGIQKIKD